MFYFLTFSLPLFLLDTDDTSLTVISNALLDSSLIYYNFLLSHFLLYLVMTKKPKKGKGLGADDVEFDSLKESNKTVPCLVKGCVHSKPKPPSTEQRKIPQNTIRNPEYQRKIQEIGTSRRRVSRLGVFTDADTECR